MIGSVVNVILACFEFGMGLVILHRALPSVLQGGRAKAVKIWALGFALLMFSIDRLTAFLNVANTPWMTLFAHGWLVAYALMRYSNIAARGIIRWGETQA